VKAHLYNPAIWYYSDDTPPSYPLMSLPILSALFNRAGINTMVYDMEAMHLFPVDAFKPYPDIIGITCMTVNRIGVFNLIKHLRKDGFTGRIICGGIYATLNPQEVLGWGADLVVTGECEGNIVELVKSGTTGIHAGQPMDIDLIPSPDWLDHLPNITMYHGNMNIIGEMPGIAMWSRGCPYKCIFCENILFNGQPTRYRSPDLIRDDMLKLRSFGISNVFLYDDELVGTKQPEGWMDAIADRIGGMNFRMIAQGRCSSKHITDDLMRAVKRAGVHTIFWGVESLSPNVLKAIKKGITIEDVYHTLEVSKRAGIKNGLYMQIGQYKEGPDEARETAGHLRRLCWCVDYMNVFVTGVMPGTELERIAKREEWYVPLPNGYRSMKHSQKQGTPWLTRGEIRKWMREYKRTCNTPRLWNRNERIERIPVTA